MSQLTLQIDGAPVRFYQANLNYSVEQLAHTFSCTIPFMGIDEPLPVEFWLGDRLVLLGQIDKAGSSTDDSSQALSISGRSKSANMIDSRITMDALYEQSIEKLLRKLAKPFGLEVQSLVGAMSPIPEFQITAESPVDNVAQLIREQGFMLIERNGILTIERAAHAVIKGVGLEVGNNITSLELSRDFSQQYHHFEVQGAWDDAHAVVTSPAINPARTMVIICDQLQSEDACLSRAQYELDLAIASSLTASSSIADVFPELAIDGLNRVIQVRDKEQNFNEMLLIKALGLSVSESSTSTSVELCRPFKEQSYA